MGARPIAALNSLRFGNLEDPRSRHLFKHVVKGIGDYGNSFGVPTVAGEVYFDSCYATNPLVNAMAVGIVKHTEVASAVAEGAGNSVILVGSSTGRDGIHGATFASEEISEKSEAKRPSVQVGDPFTEKLLLEATLEVIRAGYIVGIQDMGAAGITCSTTEMSAKGRSGMLIDLDKVPVRETEMTAYEIMLSESQERMLLVAKPGCEEKIREIFEKWDLHSVVIGTVTDDGIVSVYRHGKLKASVPAETLVLGGGAPVYFRDASEPSYLKETRAFVAESLPVPENLSTVLTTLLASPNIASKRWVYEQYDHMVRTNSVVLPGSDAAVVRIKGTEKLLSMATDCNGRYVYLNPRKGTEIAVAEAVRNVACSGATPLGITNCLNFGNPYKPEMYWQFKEAIAGMGNACRLFGTPVTGGNVSFYNESPTASVYPTPVIGVVGLIEHESYLLASFFMHPGDSIVLLGSNLGDVGGSEYLQAIHGLCAGDAPHCDLEAELRLQKCLKEIAIAGLASSAHDVSDGGIAVALAECCIGANTDLGCNVHIWSSAVARLDFLFFGEEQGRVILSVHPKSLPALMTVAARFQVPAAEIGRVTDTAIIQIGTSVRLGIPEARKAYENAIPYRMAE
jgi:phosphoribosylformylglycinamidine synthase subunit PurL